LACIPSWFQHKLAEPCVCRSGRTYRECCLGRELVFLGVAVAAGAVLLLFHEHIAALVLPVLLGVTLAIRWVHRKRGRTR
jgi:hypothetical protein